MKNIEGAARMVPDGMPDPGSKTREQRLENALAFFGSCIRSGEAWDDICQRAYEDAMRPDIAVKEREHDDPFDAMLEEMVDAYVGYQRPTDRGLAQQVDGMRLALAVYHRYRLAARAPSSLAGRQQTTEQGAVYSGSEKVAAAARPVLPEFVWRSVERGIDDALHPKGMSTHDGKAKIECSHLRYLLRAWALPTDASSRAALPEAAGQSKPNELDLAMLVKRLAAKLPSDDTLRASATDYLRRHNLLGSPLRAEATNAVAVDVEVAAAIELTDAQCDEIYYARAYSIQIGTQARTANGIERDRNLIRAAYRAAASRAVGPESSLLARISELEVDLNSARSALDTTRICAGPPCRWPRCDCPGP